jgi:transposase
VDAQIKLSVVASDSFGVSGRAMLAALVAGERDPKALAQLARTRLPAKLGPLVEAFCGFFTDQHAFLLAKMLAGWMPWTPTSPSSTPRSRS